MKHKGLFLLIALALGGVGAVHAQDAQDSTSTPQDSSASMDSMSSANYDTRWYIAPTVGGYYNDTDRNTNSRQIYYGLGFGRFVSPHASIDFFYDRTRRDSDFGGNWTSNNFGAAARFYAGGWNAWRPYGLVGVIASNHDAPFRHNGWSPAAELGLGVSKTVTDSMDFRVEGGYRYEWDGNSQPNRSGYGDWFLGLSLAFRLGPPPAPPAPPVAPPPPPPPSCDQLDDDHDNVNNCDDKCPGTPAGTIVGPDGCPQKVVIDLRGVNFKFDRPKKGETDIGPTLQVPTADSMAILDQAVDTLQRYPQVKIEVAGYTDSVGSDQYNQGLSERRAKIVYDYLTAHGIDASRLEGPTGHGENNPVDTNDTKEGRARNRRTELQVDQASQ